MFCLSRRLEWLTHFANSSDSLASLSHVSSDTCRTESCLSKYAEIGCLCISNWLCISNSSAVASLRLARSNLQVIVLISFLSRFMRLYRQACAISAQTHINVAASS